MRRRSGIFILSFFALFLGCVEIIEVDTSTEPNRLIVDGYITSESKIHQIKITETIKFSNLRNPLVEGAIVSIIASNNEMIPMPETSPGIYETASCFAAQEGVFYRIQVIYDGKTIESEEQELPERVEISNITLRPDVRKTFRSSDNQIVDEQGLWISTDIATVEQQAHYYFWQIVPTFIWVATRARSEDVSTCYIRYETKYQDIFIHSENDGGYELDLAWLPVSRRMKERYSLEVNQLNIGRDAHSFWERVKKQKDNVGSIFDSPPSSIEGNLHDVDNSKNIILGYFGVYESSRQRIFLDLDDLPFKLEYSNECAQIFRGEPRECFNCLLYGLGIASNQKPEWWQD